MRKGLATLLLSIAIPGLLGLASAQDLMHPIGEDDRFSWESLEAIQDIDLSGEELTVFGPWLGPDQEHIESVLAYFEEATGVDVVYSGSDSFEQQIVIDVQAGSPPNVAVFPQPGLAADLAERGALAPLESDTRQFVLDNYAAGESWVDLSTFAGADGEENMYVFPYKADVKSLVWYVPENLEAMGYEIPDTLEGLYDLTDQIVADGGTPWCIGLGSGDATGWPATDWVEDLVLRVADPAVYDQWVAHEIPFDDPSIVTAIERFGDIAKNPDYVQGGPTAVAATDFRDAPSGLFSIPPDCYLLKQASFIPSFFPEDVELGVDADFFYFPASSEEDLGRPVLGAGTMFGITDDTEAARALVDFLQTPIAHEIWMSRAGFLTPLQTVNTDTYANDILRRQGDILLDATTFRFDASDLMPGAIGAGAFWTGMVDYVSNPDMTAEEAAEQIERAWQDIE